MESTLCALFYPTCGCTVWIALHRLGMGCGRRQNGAPRSPTPFRGTAHIAITQDKSSGKRPRSARKGKSVVGDIAPLTVGSRMNKGSLNASKKKNEFARLSFFMTGHALNRHLQLSPNNTCEPATTPPHHHQIPCIRSTPYQSASTRRLAIT